MLLYIDPGTGSMLFTILIGVFSALIYAARNIFVKLKFFASVGKQQLDNSNQLEFVIFAESKRYWNIFKPICEEFEKRKQNLVYMTSSPDDPALNKKFQYVKCEFIGEGNKAFAKLNLLKADILLSTTPGLEVYQWKKSKDVKWYVHVLHAPNDVTAYRMFGLDYYDAVLLSGTYQKKQLRKLEELRNLQPKELAVVGLTYLDELKKKLDSKEGGVSHPFTVLLAPSWGESSIFNRYGSKIIDALLDTGYKIIIRPHPQSYISEKKMLEELMNCYPESGQLSWNKDNDNFDVLQKSDILISDFSGVIFDFALVFDKPIIYTNTSHDKAPYDACWLEEEMWTFTTLPKIGRELNFDNLNDIKKIIDDTINDCCFRKARIEARNETWMYPGEATNRTVDYLIEKHKELKNLPKGED